MSRDAFHADERGMLFATAFGPCGIAWNENGLTRLQLPEQDAAATERRLKLRAGLAGPADAPEWVSWAVVALQRYFAGRTVDFAGMCLDLSGCSDFHRRIYEALRGVGWGKTTTYGALAAEVGFTRRRPRHRPSHGSQSATDHRAVPSRARERRQDRRFFRSWRRHDQGAPAGAGGRRTSAPRNAATAGPARAGPQLGVQIAILRHKPADRP